MSINWKNVIQDQARGIDPFSAFYKEERRMREENADNFRKQQEMYQSQRKNISTHDYDEETEIER